MSDTIQRFTFAKLPVRGEIISLEQSFQTIVEQHQYPSAQRQLLGQALAASALMAETIKIEGKIALQLQSPSAIKLLLAECNHLGHIRGLVNIDESQFDEKQISEQHQTELNFSDWTHGGQMAITIEPSQDKQSQGKHSQGKRYQGIVPLEEKHLSSCLEDYFLRSEQLPTFIQLFVNDDKVCGLFLQVLPSNSESTDSEVDKRGAFEHIKTLAETVTKDEAFTLSHKDLLYRLFHQDEVTVYPEKSIEFQCNCSRERNEKALATIDPSELVSMVKESGGQLELICDFCSNKEIFTEHDVMNFLSNSTPSETLN